MNQTSQFERALSRKNLKQTLFSGLALLGSALFFCFGPPASAATVSGYIYANGVIQNDSGAPFWVEYDPETGERIESTLRAAEGDLALDKVYQMAGDTYREYAALFQTLQALYPNSSVIKLPIGEFQAAQFVDANGNVLSKVKSFVDAEKARFVIIAPPLATPNGAYQYYRAEDVVLAQMPVDPETWVGGRSLLIQQETGSIQYETENNLGFATAFFSKPGEYVQSENLFRGREDTIWNPIREAKVTEISYGGFSDRSGRYSVELERVYCLPTGNTAGLSAELNFQSFNPRNRTGMYPYYLYKEVPRPCFTMNFIHVGFGLGLWTLGTVYTPPQKYFDFQVDFSVLNGRASIGNEAVQGGTVAVVDDAQDTTYASSASLSEKVSATDKNVTYDFDRDGIPDQIHLGRVEEDAESGEETFNTQVTIEEDNVVQGVYLSSLGHTPPALPDITRQLDDSLSLEHEGLLQTITEQDLKNTDVYLFRVSTGELIAERTGATLSASDHSYQGTGVSDGTFHYTLHIRGKQQGKHKRTGFSSSRTDAEYQQVSRDEAFAAWQAESGVNPALHERESDHLRPGEPVKIIAINRATGYMGSVTTVLDGQDDEGEEETLRSAMAVISKMVKEIQMGPPNLKIWAERTYDIESGLTATNSPITQTIGNEGAALNSDDTVVLHTQWLDRDGSPLPEALADYGFTGRVARVVGDNQVSTLSGIDATFSIAPGTHLEFIQISGLSNSNDHLYVQVSGEPYSRAPSFATDALTPEEPADKFATSGNIHSGRLRYRPDHYVPFLTKVWDEASSSALELAFNQVKLTNPDSPLSKPDAVYQWLYRPDFQYSVYDFKVSELNRVENGEPQNIFQTDTPTITSSDDLLQLIYSLVGSAYDTLDGFSFSDGKDQQLIFALGETEIRATVGSNQQVNFEDLSQLGALDSEDFLSLRLYSNNDVRNVLWEFAFEHLIIDTNIVEAEDWAGDCMYVSADQPEIPLYTSFVGYASREPDTKEKHRIEWSVDGDGQLDTAAAVVDDNGFTYNTLTMPRIAGSVGSVKVKLSGGDASANFGNVCVQAGVPHLIEIVSDEEVIYHGDVSKRKYTLTVTDAWGNPVADSTNVDFEVAGDLAIINAQNRTSQGMAYVEVSATERTSSGNVIEFSVGDYIYETRDVTVSSPTIKIETSSTVVTGEIVPFTVEVSPPMEGVDIIVYSDVGIFSSNLLTTDSSGVAQSSFKAIAHAQAGKVVARLGFSATDVKNITVQGESDLIIPTPVMVADVAEQGSMQVTDELGFTYSAEYLAHVDVEVSGQPGEQIDISLGSAANPVQRDELRFKMDAIFAGQALDAAGNQNARAINVSTFSDSPIFGGKSYKFTKSETEESYLIIPSESVFNLAAEWLVRFAIKPQEQTQGVLFKLRDGVTLNSQEDNRLRLDIISGGIVQSLTTTQPVPLNEWTTVAVEVKDGVAFLTLQGIETLSMPSNEMPDESADAPAIEIGRGFVGLMSDFRLIYTDQNDHILATFADGSLSQTVVLDSNGKATVKVASSGQLRSNADYQVVDINAKGISYPLYLISRNYHRNVVIKSTLSNQEYIDAVLASDDLGARIDPFMRNFVTPAYALPFSFSLQDFLDVYRGGREVTINILGALGDEQFWQDVASGARTLGEEELEAWKENAKQMVEEIANGEFDEVSMAIITLRAALLVPLVRRYVGRLAEPIIKFLGRYGEKPVAKHLANALLKVLKPALKGDIDPLIASVYGLVFIADVTELILSDEGAELVEIADELMNSIDSADDLVGIFSFARLAVQNLDATCTGDLNLIDYVETGSLYEPFVTKAYAQRGALSVLKRIKVGTFFKRLKNAKLKVELDNDPDRPAAQNKKFSLAKAIRSLGDAMLLLDQLPAGSSVSEELKALLESITDERVLLVGMVLSHREGPGAIKSLLSGKLPLRTGLTDLVAAIAKIETAAADGFLDRKNYEFFAGQLPTNGGRQVKWKIREKYKNVFLNVVEKTDQTKMEEPTSYIAINKMNGDAFHLATIAKLLAEQSTILGVESETSVHFKKSVPGGSTPMGKALARRVDIVTGENLQSAHWHEVKSLAFNTKRQGRPERRGAYKRALVSLDLSTITTVKKVSIEDQILLGEDALDLVVRSNQFYTKEFFIDRVYAQANISMVPSRMRWVFQDFAKSDMNAFDSRSSSKKHDLVVHKEHFLQCGINKVATGQCASVYGNSSSIDEVREKLATGIRHPENTSVLGIIKHTFSPGQFIDDDDIRDYLSEFKNIKNDIIFSENSKEWLLSNTSNMINSACEASP